MTCAACSSRVEKAVLSLDGVTNCSVNLLTNTMDVDGTASEENIINAVVSAGYGIKSNKTDNDKSYVKVNEKFNLIKEVIEKLLKSY